MKKIRIVRIAIIWLLVISCITLSWTCAAEETTYGTAGVIMEAPRDPESADNSNWLTIQNGEAGTRIVTNESQEIIAVDNFGGIYLNGDVYLNGKLLDAKMFNLGNGFMYLLLVISITMNAIVLVKLKKRDT